LYASLYQYFPWLIHSFFDRGSKHNSKVSQFLPEYMAQHPRRQSSSYSFSWEPQISPDSILLLSCSNHAFAYTYTVKQASSLSPFILQGICVAALFQ
jgi:hypothetical protein